MLAHGSLMRQAVTPTLSSISARCRLVNTLSPIPGPVLATLHSLRGDQLFRFRRGLRHGSRVFCASSPIFPTQRMRSHRHVTIGYDATSRKFYVIPAAVKHNCGVGLPLLRLTSGRVELAFLRPSKANDAVQQLWPNAWLLETADAFAVLPVPLGDCAQRAVPVPSL